MGEMWDYVAAPMSYANMKKAGCTVVSRYVSPSSYGSFKNLTPREASDLRGNGFDIITNFEGYADFRNEPGYDGNPFNAGVKHAAVAYQQHHACGGPDHIDLPFSFDVPDLDGPTCDRYLQGVQSTRYPIVAAAYGRYAVLDYLFQQNRIRVGWMTNSWRYGAPVHPQAALWQYGYLGSYDKNKILTAHCGGWSQAVEAPTVVVKEDEGDDDMYLIQVDKHTVPKGAQWPGYFLLTGDARLVHVPPAQVKTDNPKDTSSNVVGLVNAGMKDGGWITYSFFQQLTSNDPTTVKAALAAWNPGSTEPAMVKPPVAKKAAAKKSTGGKS